MSLLLSGWKPSLVPSPLLPNLGEVGQEIFLLSCGLLLLGRNLRWGRLPLDASTLNPKALAVSPQALCRQVPLHLLHWLRDSVGDPILVCPSTLPFLVCWFFLLTPEPSRWLQVRTEAGGSGVARVERDHLSLLSFAFIREWKSQKPQQTSHYLFSLGPWKLGKMSIWQRVME